MTDSPAPLSDDDLSADLDDEAGMDVRARILADPAASTRQAKLAEVSQRLADGAVAGLAPEQVDALVTNALDAAGAPPAPRHSGRGAGPWLVAAAVVLLVGIGLTLIWTGREESTQTSADASTTAPTADGSSSEDAATRAQTTDTERETSAAEPEVAATDQAPFVGSFTTADALREALAESLEPVATTDSTMDPPSAEALARCEQQLQITLELDDAPLASGYAVVDDQLVLVYEWDHESFTDGRPTTLVTAVGNDACDEVALFER